MIYLTQEDKSRIKYDGWDKIKRIDLSNGSFYAKFTGRDGAFRELFGKKIFDSIGIPSPEYLYIKEENCILSTDLKEKYHNFKFAYQMADIRNMNDLYELLKCFKNYDELITQVNIMHFIDILFGNTDRHSNNYGFVFKEDGTASLVVFDNEEMLFDFLHATRPVSFPTENHLCFIDYSKEAEYKYFLESLSDDQKQILYSCLRKFDLKTVYSIMNAIENENNCRFKNKRKMFMNYIKNYIMIYKNTIRDRNKQVKQVQKQIAK